MVVTSSNPRIQHIRILIRGEYCKGKNSLMKNKILQYLEMFLDQKKWGKRRTFFIIRRSKTNYFLDSLCYLDPLKTSDSFETLYIHRYMLLSKI